MRKKLILGLGAVVVVVAGVVAMSAFEAHVINVTAHIENALAVSTEALDFGTVFPQEYLEKDFTITLSESFMAEDRVDDVEYVIKQKPKPIWNDGVPAGCTSGAQTVEEARAYCHDSPEDLNCCYLSLCPYLSKINEEEDEDEGDAENDTDSPSYYVPAEINPVPVAAYCDMCQPEAAGKLSKEAQDTEDRWVVDLKVPPFAGYVAQDWPEGCPVLDADPNGTDLGCDLWIEVTEISEIDFTCEKWDCLTDLEKDFFTTGRHDPTNWDMAIWDAHGPGDADDTVEQSGEFPWVDEQAESFTVSYDPITGNVTYTIADTTLVDYYGGCLAFTHVIPFAKGNTTNHAHLTNMTLNGNSIDDIHSNGGYWGEKIPLSDADQVNGFTLTGTVMLDWEGTHPQENPGFHVFAMGTHPLPGCPQ